MDIKQMYDYCASNHTKADLGCSYGEGETPKQAKHLAQKIPRGLDNRVTGIIMLDPASTKASMNSVKVPTLIFESQNNDFLPFKYHAKYYAGNISNAKLIALNTGEGHFFILIHVIIAIKHVGYFFAKIVKV
jgi:predicted dienelactone hydrolase